MILTLAGTALSLAGVACGVVAIYGTHRKFGDGPLLPDAYRRVRRWWATIRRVLLRRQPQTITGTVHVTSPGPIFSGRGRVTWPPISDEADLDQRVTLLIRRFEHLEREIETDRRSSNEALAAIRSEMKELDSRLGTETSTIEARTKDMFLGTVRLQLLGLFLVLTGTILLSAGSLVEA